MPSRSSVFSRWPHQWVPSWRSKLLDRTSRERSTLSAKFLPTGSARSRFMGLNTAPGGGKKVGLIGVPLGYAAGQPGSELGVEAMRLSRFRGSTLADHIGSLGYDV